MNTISMKRLQGMAAAFLLLLLAGCTTGTPSGELTDPKAPGHITVREDQVLRIGANGAGEGTLLFRGWQYKFEVENMVISAVGRGAIELDGDVWNLNDVKDFEGTYRAVKQDFEADKGLSGVWLENEKGVSVRIVAVGQDLSIRTDSAGSVVTLK